jgi:hypothetical protein
MAEQKLDEKAALKKVAKEIGFKERSLSGAAKK